MAGRGTSGAIARLAGIAGIAGLACLAAVPAAAEVVRIEVERRLPLRGGEPFGERGAYELIEGRAHFAIDPGNEANASITDVGLAPTGPDGRVAASAEVVVLQPIDPAKRRGTALVGIANRGRRLELASLNRIPFDLERPAAPDPDGDFGDGFLMELGLTLVWVGWQHDAPAFPGAVRLRVPRARNPDGSPIRGLARSDWVVEEPTDTLRLATPGHAAHPAADPEARENRLTVRDSREGERRLVPREAWRFDETRTAIVAKPGFQVGRIYELVYLAQNPPVGGLGFAAVRDIAAHALHARDSLFPVQRAVATGSSQSGRFLRHFLHEGMNRDEAGRRVYDGVIVNVAGAGRGGFDHRFSQPGRVGNPYRNFFYPGDDFPFASRRTRDPATGEPTGLFDRARASDSLPKIFQKNGGYEYWGRAASLVHTTPDGSRDLAPLPDERLYHVASAPHYPMPFPPRPEAEVSPGVFRGSSLGTSAIDRALLVHMLAWVEQGAPPPPSRVPRIDAGSLVAASGVRNPAGLPRLPKGPHAAYRLDFGPRWPQGIIDHQPPERGPRYAVRVPQVDALGNEVGGIRPLAVRVPIGSYAPWALRTGHPVAPEEMSDFLGTFAPLARAPATRRPGDERPDLSQLHPSREAYRARLESALDELTQEGFLLPRDREAERAQALARWEWIAARGAGEP